jgi:hypothetical protein
MTDLSDATRAPLWLGATALLAASGWAVARKYFPGEPWSTRVLHTTVVCWAVVVFACALLGAVGGLTPVPLVAVVAGVSAVTLVAANGRGVWAGPAGPTSGPGAVAGADDSPVTRSAEWLRWAWSIAWGLVFAFVVGRVVTGGLLRFPDDWDTLMYHLPLVDHWLQAGSLYAPDDLRWSEPGNNELVALWCVAPFSGDFLYGFNAPACWYRLSCSTWGSTRANQLQAFVWGPYGPLGPASVLTGNRWLRSW